MVTRIHFSSWCRQDINTTWFPVPYLILFHSLVYTYVVCERLSVMHEPAGVVENLVQILQNTPILKYSFRIPPPPQNENCQRSWHFDFSVSEYPPPPPPQFKFRQILALCDFSVSEYPPSPKFKFRQILALCDFSVSEYPPPPNSNLGRSWHFVTFQFQNTPPPPKIQI